MSSTIVIQIYAFTEVREAVAALELGVDQVGFVAGDYSIVHGELTIERAAEIVRGVGKRGTSVALTMASDHPRSSIWSPRFNPTSFISQLTPVLWG